MQIIIIYLGANINGILFHSSSFFLSEAVVLGFGHFALALSNKYNKVYDNPHLDRDSKLDNLDKTAKKDTWVRPI